MAQRDAIVRRIQQLDALDNHGASGTSGLLRVLNSWQVCGGYDYFSGVLPGHVKGHSSLLCALLFGCSPLHSALLYNNLVSFPSMFFWYALDVPP